MTDHPWEPVISGMRFPEGPVAGRGFVACVDLDGGAIWVVRDDGRPQRLVVGGRPNGLAYSPPDSLLVADSGRDAIVTLTWNDETPVVLFSGLLGPNDLIVDGEGGIFTDPGGSSVDDAIGRVIRWQGSSLNTIAEGMAFPNGLCRDSEGRLIVAETKKFRLLVLDEHGDYDVFVDRVTSPAGGWPDGLDLLPDGRIAAALYGGGKISLIQDNRLDAFISAPGKHPTNITHDSRYFYCTEVDTGTLWRTSLIDIVEASHPSSENPR